MNLVSGVRDIERIARSAVAHPFLIMPFIIEPPGARGSRGRQLATECVRIRFVHLIAAVARCNPILVARSRFDARDESLPYTAVVAPRRQRVAGLVPVVEVPEDAHTLRVRRPDGEARTGCTRFTHQMAAELFVQTAVCAFFE